MCVCVCVCVNRPRLAGSFQTQAASTISQLMIFNSKNEFDSQKQDTQTSTTPDGYQCTFVTCINSETPISVSSLLQWWVCCAQAHDQAHEQCNAMVKRNGGAAGLASNPGALRRWVTTGPQIARLLKSFEHSMTSKSADCMDHHVQSHAPQKAFKLLLFLLRKLEIHLKTMKDASSPWTPKSL